MTDDEALVALALGNEREKEAARDYLADEYVPRLMVITRRLVWDEDVADEAAARALDRLRRVAETAPGSLPPPERLLRWLARAAIYEVRDTLRRARGRQLATIEGLDGHEEDLHSSTPPAERPLENSEMARDVLAFILARDDPERGILLHDVFAEISVLTTAEVEIHDDMLIDASKEHPLWSRNALRSHRSRARQELQEYLIKKGYMS